MIAVLLSGALLMILNATFLSPALPAIMADLGVGPTTAQWLTSAYNLTEAVVVPLNAFLIGRFPTRRLFLGGVAWFGIAAIIGAIAPNFHILLLARIMMATATGVVMPMVFTLIVLTFPRERRGSAMGIVGLIIAFAPAVGPSTSGIVVDSIGWRALFVIVAAITLIVFLAALAFLKNREGFERVPFDAVSILLLAVGMVSLLYGVSSATSAEILAIPLALIAGGIALLALFVRRQFRLDTPVLRIGILSSRPYRTAVALIVFLQAELAGSTIILPIYVQQVRGYDATTSGLLMLPGAILGAFLGLAAGRIFDKRGVRGLALVSAATLTLGALGVIYFNLTMPIIGVTFVYTTIAAGIQFLNTPLNTWGLNSLDNSVVQHANSLGNTINQIGASCGAAFITSLTALAPHFAPAGSDEKHLLFTGVHLAFIGIAGVLFVVVIGTLVAVRDKPADEQAKKAMQAAARANAPAGAPVRERDILVADVMNAQPAFLTEDVTVREAIRAMTTKELTGIPVVDAEGNLTGFITDGDIMRFLSPQDKEYVLEGRIFATISEDESVAERLQELLALPVTRLASKNRIHSFEVHDDAEQAFQTLSEKHIRKAPVLADGKLVGTLSRRDVIKALVVLGDAR